MNTTFDTRSKTRKLAIIGMLSGISIFLGITRLGFIPLGITNATIMHIPVIIGSIIEGPIVGALIGLVFGLFSMYQNIVTPSVTSFLFWNPIIALLPRILIGVVSYYVFKFMLKGAKKNITATSILVSILISFLLFFATSHLTKSLTLAISLGFIIFVILTIVMLKFKHNNKEVALSIGMAAVLGTLTNTVGVLGLAYIIYLERYALALGVSNEVAGTTLLGIGIGSGIPEAIVSALIAIPVIIGVNKVFKNSY